MTSLVNKNSPAYSEPYIYENRMHGYQIGTTESTSDKLKLGEVSTYYSHLDRLFQQTKTSQIYIDPPSMLVEIEKRLFLLDIIYDYKNLVSYWESALKKLDNLPQDSSTSQIRKLYEIMGNLSQISRDISTKRYQLQKG